MNDLTIFSAVLAKTLQLFLILDPIGNIGIIATLLKPYDLPGKRRILKRESLFALLALIIFYIGGSKFLSALHISQAAIEITGGIIFMTFAVHLLFPKAKPELHAKQEPYVVPIAIPLFAGPSSLATVILYSNDAVDPSHTIIVVSAIFLAWLLAAAILVLSPNFVKLLGNTGLKVCERIMALICVLVAVKMLSGGITTFLHSYL